MAPRAIVAGSEARRVAERVRLLRLERRLTLRDVAARIGLPHTSVSDMERVARRITVDELYALASVFEMSVPELLDCEVEESRDALVSRIVAAVLRELR